MKVFVTILFLVITGSFVKSDRAEDDSNACIVRMLQEKGLLDHDFPHDGQPRMCFLVQTVVTSLENGFYTKFDEKESIKADCVKTELKNNNFVYRAMKKEIIESSKMLSRDDINKMLNENKEDMKNVLNDAAKDCQSDPTWAGIFDEILDITNTSKTVVEQNYCSLKTSIDKKLINIGDFDINPHNIDTSKIDCDKIIEELKTEIDEKLRSEYNKKGLSRSSVECVINNFRNSRFYEISIAIGALEKNDIDSAVRAENKEKLTPQLQSGIAGLFSCFFG
ncbi:unnamed protein product [Chironomus riparius]|uniref:Uncharacterized protein n=1 Tax=Chironomus riparius TaxID=315576 RepID=A0A9N9S031_9DIPT|nr:unnamed protein product [Chironomus riparius]